MELRIGYDANRSPVSRSYVRASDGAGIASSAAVTNGRGKWVTHTTSASAKQYGYDGLQRLTDVRDTVAGACTWRSYGYDDRAGRTSLATSVSGTSVCVDPADPGAPSVATVGYVYDSADRLVSDTGTVGEWVYDPLGRITGAPVRGSPKATVVNGYWSNDLIASQTVAGVARQSWALDPLGRFSSYRNEAWAVGGDGQPGWQEAVTKVNHYDSDADSPAWVVEDASLPSEVTRYVEGLDGSLAVQTGLAGDRVLQLVDLHGDVMGSLPVAEGAATADAAVTYRAADEFGNPTDLTTGAAVAGNGSAPDRDERYGWHGGAQRSADALAGVLLMGVRLYDPGTGRFWSPDSVPGGNATPYDYCSGDPVNCADLTGLWGLGDLVGAVAKVGEVVATVVPGPLGAAAGAISAGAYAAGGNTAKAVEVAVVSAAAMVGAGAAVKAGWALAKFAGRVSAKVGKATVTRTKRGSRGGGSCPVNSFTADTPVLLADGTTLPIDEIAVGDLVTAMDPHTGALTAQPVLDVIVGVGTKHLITVTTATDVTGDGEDTWTATASHPIWVHGQGWTDTDDLDLGDQLLDATGGPRTVVPLDDHGQVASQTVYNLSVGNVHTYLVGGDRWTLVHNVSCPRLTGQSAKSLSDARGMAKRVAARARAAGRDADILAAREGRYNTGRSVRTDVTVVISKRRAGGERAVEQIHHIRVKNGRRAAGRGELNDRSSG